MWSGRERDRSASSCYFCDTDFVGTDGEHGGVYQCSELVSKIDLVWRQCSSTKGSRYLVFTGGEPTLQVDSKLLHSVKGLGFETAIETNGSAIVPTEIDWITVSPKSMDNLVQKTGNELKLLYPFSISPEEVEHLAFENYLLSPIVTGIPERDTGNLKEAINYCLANPKWQLTTQQHKNWNIR